MRCVSDSGSPRRGPFPIRFSPPVATQARILAEQDGMSVSAWIRHITEREIARRKGHCPSCGQEVK